MDFDNIDDEKLQRLIREEFDRREKEKQRLCAHAKSGTMRRDGTIICDDCSKILTLEDAESGYTEELSSIEEELISGVKSGKYG